MSEATAIHPSGMNVNPSPEVAKVRARMMEGRTSVPTFAEGIGKTERTVFAYIAEGMPCDYIGRTPYPIIDPALEWLRSRRRRDHEPPRRGRPRKKAT